MFDLFDALKNGELYYLQSHITRENVNMETHYGLLWKPLEVVAACGHDYCIPFLLSIGANVTKPDEHGKTPLFYAVDTNFGYINLKGKVECVRLLARAWPRLNGLPIVTPDILFCPLRKSIKSGPSENVVELTLNGWPLEQYETLNNPSIHDPPWFRKFCARVQNVKNSIAAFLLVSSATSVKRIIGKDMIHLITKEMWQEGIK